MPAAHRFSVATAGVVAAILCLTLVATPTGSFAPPRKLPTMTLLTRRHVALESSALDSGGSTGENGDSPSPVEIDPRELTADIVEGIADYRVLQSLCTTLRLGGRGKEVDLRNKLLEYVERSSERCSPEASPSSSSSSSSHDQGGRRRKTERQIRQLCYVMVRDVEDLLQSADTAPEAPARALENIERLQKLYDDGVATDDDGDDKTYEAQCMGDLVGSLVRAYARSGVEGHAELAEETFRDMTTRWGVVPIVETACAVIDGYARRAAKTRRRNRNRKNNNQKSDGSGPLDAERLLFELMDDAEKTAVGEEPLLPTSACCNAVIKAWARQNSREGAERAHEILVRMEYFATTGTDGGGRAIHPTVYSYATVVTAWNRGVGGHEAAKRANTILHRLLEKNKEVQKARAKARRKDDKSPNQEEQFEGVPLIVPNTILFNAVIDCWAQSSHPTAGTKALDLLKLMKGVGGDALPDAVTYRSVINAFAASSHINAAQSAEGVMAMAQQDGILIDTRTYNVVLKAWSASAAPNAAKKAEKLLVEMIEAQKAGDIIIGPDAYSWSTVLSSLAKSTEPGKARRASNLLDAFADYSKKTSRVGDDGSKPNTSCYNTVLNACAFSAMASEEERKEALKIAVETFQELLNMDGVEADYITYGTMLKCIANLVPPESIDNRNQLASKIFQRCAGSGFVNGLVLKEFKRCVSNDCLLDVAGDGGARMDRRKGGSSLDRLAASITLSSLPREWKANVLESRKESRRRGEKEKERNGESTGKPNQKRRQKKQEKKEDNVIFQSVPGFQIVETSWQSGRDV